MALTHSNTVSAGQVALDPDPIGDAPPTVGCVTLNIFGRSIYTP